MKPDALDQAIKFLFLLILFWSPLPFGSVEAWSMAVLQIGCFSLLALWTVQFARGRVGRFNVHPLVFPAAVLAGEAVLQVLPLSANGPHSQTPAATLFFFRLLLSLAVVLVILPNIPFDEREYRRCQNLFIVWGTVIAGFALIQYLTWNGRIYWVREISSGNCFGPFVNRNHYAGFIEMLLPFPFVFLFFRKTTPVEKAFYLASAGVMGLSIFLSTSRGGILALVCELTFLGAVAVATKTNFSRETVWGSLLVILGFITIGLFWFGPEPLIGRLESVPGDASISRGDSQPNGFGRFEIWKAGWRMFQDHPVWGVGFGAFGVAFTKYDPGIGQLRVEHAHNDFLQLMTDGGLIAFAAGVLFLFLFFGRTGLILARGKKSARIRIIGSATACLGLLVHSNFDFNLQIPSNALLFVFLAALATRENPERSKNRMKIVRRRRTSRSRRLRQSEQSGRIDAVES